ncbi:MAG: helix-turn-helix domain-containing protein [Agarilytica sp.]
MNNIKSYRKQLGLTQAQLSVLCGWGETNSRVSNYENNGRSITVTDAQTIVEAFLSSGAECSLDMVFPSKNQNLIENS